jgi:hypothetical protein
LSLKFEQLRKTLPLNLCATKPLNVQNKNEHQETKLMQEENKVS